MHNPEELFTAQLQAWGLPLCSGETLRRLRIYAALLAEKNRSMNLTAVDDPAGIFTRHFLESVSVLSAGVPEGARIIDVGCGAGFPGLPLKIVCDGYGIQTELSLLDSTAKKIDFLREVCEATGTRADFLPIRAEEAAAGAHREQYSLALSRAVARMNMLCELCLPFVRTGGRFIAVKSAHSEEEAREAAGAITLLGGKREEDILRTVEHTQMDLRLVCVTKISQTPPKYPRKFAQIKAKPL